MRYCIRKAQSIIIGQRKYFSSIDLNNRVKWKKASLFIWVTVCEVRNTKGKDDFIENKIFMLITYIKQKMECFLQGNYFLWWVPFMHDGVLNFWKPPWLFFYFLAILMVLISGISRCKIFLLKASYSV